MQENSFRLFRNSGTRRETVKSKFFIEPRILRTESAMNQQTDKLRIE
jgi:hypothetical protein